MVCKNFEEVLFIYYILAYKKQFVICYTELNNSIPADFGCISEL